MKLFKYLCILTLLQIFIQNSPFAQVPSNSKDTYLELLKLNNSGKYKAAILQGKILTAQEPRFPLAYEQLTAAFEKAGKIEKGLTFFDSLQQLFPNNSCIFYANALLEKANKNYDQAVANCKKSIKLHPNFAGVYFHLVDIYNELNDLETPSKYFQNLLKEDSLNAFAYYGLGCIFNLKIEWDKGAKAFAKCLEINPNIVHAYYLKGLMQVNQRDLQQALETWDKGKDIAAKLNDIQLEGMMTGNVGNVYHNMGQPGKAIPYREKAIKLAQEISDKKQEERHLSNLGNSYKDLGQPDKAIELYDQGLTIAHEIGDKEFEETLLGNKSAALTDIGKYKEAIQCGTAALKLAIARGDSSAVASHCWNIGAACTNIADYKNALYFYNRALHLKRAENDQRGVCSLLGNLGTLLKDMGEIKAAVDTFQLGLDIAHKIKSKRHELFLLGSLGYAYSGWSDYSNAIKYFEEAYSIADSLNAEPAKGTYLGNIGVIYKKWGNFTRAIGYLKRALKQDVKIKNPRGVVRHYVNMANIYEIRGDYVQALNLEKKSLALSDSIGTRNYSAIILGNIGVAYDKIGDYDEALSYMNRAYKLIIDIPVKGAEANVLINMGSVYEKMENDTKALDCFEKALNAAEEIGEQETMASAFIAIGDIHVRKKQYTQGMNYYKKALDIVKETGNKNQEGKIYQNYGDVYNETGKFIGATEYFQKSMKIGERLKSFELTFESLKGLASINEKQKKYEEAVDYYDQAINRIESVREGLKIEDYKIQFMDSKIAAYESIITLLIKLKKYKKAYKYLQKFRSRCFLDILSPERIDYTQGISPELFEQHRFWEQKLREIYEKFPEIYKKAESENNYKLVNVLNDSLKSIQNELENVINEIQLKHPVYAELTGLVKPIEIPEVQSNLLQHNQSILEYFVGPEFSAVWVIQTDSVFFKELNITKEDLKEKITLLRQPFTDAAEGRINNLLLVNFDTKLANELYKLLFLPIENYLSQNSELIIIPDGILYYLPFETLVTISEEKPHDTSVAFSRYENSHYLIEKYPISYIHSISILKQIRDSEKKKTDADNYFLGIGSPDFGQFTEDFKNVDNFVALKQKHCKGLRLTPISEQDVNDIGQIMKPATILLKEDATEDNFKNKASNYYYIYLSTHAIADENQPMYSLIALSQDDDPKEDGFLHAYEVFNMKINADLVTLSACETGLGKLSRGEGFIGLTRSFLYAGSKSVVVSLWSVEESTTMLMKDFYLNIKQGMNKAKALRQAKLKLIKTRKDGISFSHPYLWAPFVLFGDWE